MTTEDALAELELTLSWSRKLSCPKHSDSDPSLHVYPNDKGFYCFSCGKGGDGWGLLSHYLNKPVGELMRDRGASFGPRPKARWEYLSELEQRANAARWSFHLKVRALGLGLSYVRDIEDRIALLYVDNISARYFPEDKPPSAMEQTVYDLESFLDSEMDRAEALAVMARG